MFRPLALALLGLTCMYTRVAQAVPEGEEEFDTQTSGKLYVFADQIIHIVDPLTMEIVANITKDQSGAPLTNTGSVGNPVNTSRTWNDAVLVENPSKGLRHVYVNEGDVYQDSNGSQYSYVTVIDAVAQQIVARQKIGGVPVHIYYVNSTSSAWSHSDLEGTFYVLTAESASNISLTTTVPSYVTVQAHGKLIVNGALEPVGYGSNVREQILEKINLTTASRTAHFNFSSFLPSKAAPNSPTVCAGTHTIVYSQVNQHLYAECVDGMGTVEWNTMDDTFVALLDVVGTLYNAPAGDMIFVTNADNSTSAVLHPGSNGEASTVLQYIQVPYQPGDPVLYSNATSIAPASAGNYTAFFPTLRNTNLNDIKSAAAAGGSITDVGYYGQNTADDNGTPFDCEYVPAADVFASSTVGLQLLNGTNGPLTPSCGACAAGITPVDPSQYNASLAGVGVINLADLAIVIGASSTVNVTLVSAGAVAPALSLGSDANECSFAQVARDAVRGGPWIAVTADLPQPSIYVLDAAAPRDPLYGKGYVATADSPVKIVWVPSVEGVAAVDGVARSPAAAASMTALATTAAGHEQPD